MQQRSVQQARSRLRFTGLQHIHVLHRPRLPRLCSLEHQWQQTCRGEQPPGTVTDHAITVLSQPVQALDLAGQREHFQLRQHVITGHAKVPVFLTFSLGELLPQYRAEHGGNIGFHPPAAEHLPVQPGRGLRAVQRDRTGHTGETAQGLQRPVDQAQRQRLGMWQAEY